jgi:hypothetical protein
MWEGGVRKSAVIALGYSGYGRTFRSLASGLDGAKLGLFPGFGLMNSHHNGRRRPLKPTAFLWQAGVVLGTATAWCTAILPCEAGSNVLLWDTGSRFTSANELEARVEWKAVPSELFNLEADPPKAASDPGYYGREYAFRGDLVVENHRLAAVFWSAKGRVVLYAKAQATEASSTSEPIQAKKGLGKALLEFAPLQSKSPAAKISRCEVLRNAGDEAIIQAFFSSPGAAEESAVFSFGKAELVEIKPSSNMKQVRLFSPIEYAVVPAFIGDDLLLRPADYPAADILSVPADNVLIGLLKGEDSELVMTWPKGKQSTKLRLTKDSAGQRIVESLEFEPDGQSFYLAALTAPGLWHREELKPAYLEKDVALSWPKPFAAKWKTQLPEADVKTTFTFREAKGQIWRGVPGSYNYPAWFDGDKAFLHLSKKVPPKGEALIYFLEGQGTPWTISTPVDIVKATLGRQQSEAILDSTGRKLRTHHRRGGDGVHRACTCGCTEAIQAIFEAGHEMTKKDQVKAALEDMIFFVECHVERINEYQRFAADTLKFLRTQAAATPDLKGYLESLEQTLQQIPEECSVQKENMKSPEYVTELTRKTMALTASRNTNNLAAYMELLKAWRAMGGAQDYVVAQCHTLTRKLFQQAGYNCVNDEKAIPVAREVRARCRQILRQPDGYEIWADY